MGVVYASCVQNGNFEKGVGFLYLTRHCFDVFIRGILGTTYIKSIDLDSPTRAKSFILWEIIGSSWSILRTRILLLV